MQPQCRHCQMFTVVIPFLLFPAKGCWIEYYFGMPGGVDGLPSLEVLVLPDQIPTEQQNEYTPSVVGSMLHDL